MENKSNVEQFIHGTVHYFKQIGFEFEEKHKWMKFMLIAGILNMGGLVIELVMTVPFADIELQAKLVGITYMNYFFVSIGKMIALLYNRRTLLETLNEFRQIYPSKQIEKAYKLQIYLRHYKMIENILVTFYHSITVFFNFYPLAVSLTELARYGTFTYWTCLMMWIPNDNWNHWWSYLPSYVHQIFSNYEAALIILGLDLCLFSLLLQLCMHFDIVNQNILTIEPDASDEAERKLKEIIVYHQRVLRLSDKINDIFTPSVLFCLLSSSFIICFTGYQLLGEITMVTVIKAVVLLFYEMKQAIITCFLGDRLMENSVKASEAIYDHKWYNGSMRYKRLVLIFMIRSQKATALKIAGISEISRQTLRAVMSMSYRILTVLKTA